MAGGPGRHPATARMKWNKIKAANTWAVSLMRYGAGTIKWNKEELQDTDRKSRKIMTMNKELNQEVALPE